MTLVDELREEARGEIEATRGYRNLASRLRSAGHYSEGNLVDSIADDEDRHANLLMSMANSIVAKEEPETPGWEQRIQYELGHRRPSQITASQEEYEKPMPADYRSGRLFPQTYGDWVDLAEDIKQRMPEGSWSLVNNLLQIISEGGPEAEESKRWLMEKAAELGIS